MDLEEQRLKHQIQERESALRAKVDTLKDRLGRIRRLSDVKLLVDHHTGLAMGGSVLVGFLARRFTAGRNHDHRANGAYRADFRNPPSKSESAPATRLWEPVIAAVSAVAARAAIGLIGEIGKKFVPRRHRARQSERYPRNNDVSGH